MGFRLILLLFLLYHPTFGQSDFDLILRKGLDYSYNFQLKEAEKLFEDMIDKYPRMPHGYHYISQIHLWIFLGNKDEGEYGIFFKYSDLAMERAEEQINIDEKNNDVMYILGSVYTLRAMAFSTNGSALDAFWASKSAVNTFEDLIEINPEYYDAYLGLGIFDYALSFVPGIFKWALSLTGLAADKELGLNRLRIAAEKGNLSKTEASFHLAKVYMEYVAEYDSAAYQLNKIIDAYPNSSLFHYQYAVLMINARSLNEAEESLVKVIQLDHPNFKQTTAYSYFLLGDIFYRRNNFQEAINYYQKFLIETRSIDYTGIANFRLAICYKKIGKEMPVKKQLILARYGNLDIPDDLYAKEKSELLFDIDISKDYLLTTQAKNNLDAGEFTAAYNMLKGIVNSFISDDIKGNALVIMSEAAIELNNLSLAQELANEALSLEYNNEEWVIAQANYLLAKASYLIGDYTESEKYLIEADDNNKYDFRDKLEPHINNLYRKIKIPLD